MTTNGSTSLSLTKATQSVAPVTETPAGTAAQVRASTIQNGTLFNSLFVQKQLSPTLWLQYPGCYVTKCTLSGQIGKFFDGSFSVLAQKEASSTTQAGSSVTAAPTGSVMSTVSGFGGAFISEGAIVGVVDTISLTIENTGAANEFGMGSSASQGQVMGEITVTGSMRMFFQSLTYYNRFKAETAGTLEFIVKDAAGNAYVFTLLNAILSSGKVQITGPNSPVYATFDIEGNPQSPSGTIQLDRLPAT